MAEKKRAHPRLPVTRARLTCEEVAQEDEQEVRVDVALMHFVQDDVRHRVQSRVAASVGGGEGRAQSGTCGHGR